MEQPIKVIHVIGGGEYGGAEEHILQLLTHFPKEKISVKVVAFYDAKFARILREKGIEVVVLDYPRFDIRLIKGLKSIFQQENPDIIHTHGVKANFFGRLAVGRGTNAQVVTTIHSLLKYDYPNPLAYFVTSFMEKSTRGYVNRFIAISHAIEKELKQEGQDGKRISVIYHGIEVEKFHQPEFRSEARTEFNIPEDSFAVGMIARMVKVKGIDDFVKAAGELLKTENDVHFVLVGDGPELPAIREQITSLHLNDRFTLTGFRSDIPKCLAGLDCFVSPSLSEGLGLSVLEAMAAEVPVVATGVGGVLDYLKDRENGLIVDVHSPVQIAEAIRVVKNDLNLRNQIISNAKKHVLETFSVERMAKDTIQLYKDLNKQG